MELQAGSSKAKKKARQKREREEKLVLEKEERERKRVKREGQTIWPIIKSSIKLANSLGTIMRIIGDSKKALNHSSFYLPKFCHQTTRLEQSEAFMLSGAMNLATMMLRSPVKKLLKYPSPKCLHKPMSPRLYMKWLGGVKLFMIVLDL